MSSPSDLDQRVSWSPPVDHISRMVLYSCSLSSHLLIIIPCNLCSPIILVILQLIVAIATPCFGSETQSLAMPIGAYLQSMFTPVPLRASCLLSCLSVVPFLIFFLSTTMKSAPPSCTDSADCGCICPFPTTLANEGAVGGGGRGGVDGWIGPAVWGGGGVTGWVGLTEVSGRAICSRGVWV